MIQSLNTLRQILHSDSVDPATGFLRHLRWQCRRLFRLYPVELRLSSSVLHVDDAMGIAALVNAMGKYDYNNMSFLSELLLRVGGTFVDVGANIGTYTLVVSENPAARVISIEPHPKVFAQLAENVRRNGRGNVVCLNLALSDHQGVVQLTDQPGLSLNRVLEATDDGCPSVAVPCRTMAAVCREIGVTPDFVKIDVEGYEELVLDGFGSVATECKAFVVEGGERAGIRGWMHEVGFDGPFFVHFDGRRLSRTPRPRAEDPVFISPQLVSSLRHIDFTIAGVNLENG